MSVSSVGSNLSLSVANLATSQASENVRLDATVAVMKMAQDAQMQILDLISQTLGVGTNIDLLA